MPVQWKACIEPASFREAKLELILSCPAPMSYALTEVYIDHEARLIYRRQVTTLEDIEKRRTFWFSTPSTHSQP